MCGIWWRTALLLGYYLAGHECLGQRGPISPLPLAPPVIVGPIPGGVLDPRREATVSQATQAAEPTARARNLASPRPLVLLNSRLIIGLDGMSGLNPENIEKISIYKGGNYPGAVAPAQWRSLATNGIIDVTLKHKVRLKSQSLAQLGHHLRAKEPVSYTINGLPAASGTLRIATEAIEEIKLVRTLAGTTLSVRVYSVSNQPTKTHPPGTIMIRGAASL